MNIHAYHTTPNKNLHNIEVQLRGYSLKISIKITDCENK